MTGAQAAEFDAKRFGLTLLLVAALYWVCLQFVFPGFFAPADPLHSDYYLPPALVGDEEPIWSKLDYPRPAGFFALWVFGHAGLQGATALIIGVSLLNAALIAELWRRLAPGMIGWVGVALFAAYLFGHPQAYANHAHDAMAALSLLYLLLAIHAWENWLQGGRRVWLVACVPLIGLLVLTKETYFVAALIYWLWQVFRLDAARRRTAVVALLVIGSLELAGADASLGARQGFVQPNRDPTHPYFIDVSPGSVLSSLGTLLSHQLPLASLLLLGLALAVAWMQRETLRPALMFLLAGFSALLPHALLPNHLEPNYGWVGATLTFSPLLLVGMGPTTRAWLRWAAPAMAVVLVVAGWTLDRRPYEAHRWQVEQQRILGNTYVSFHALRQVPDDAKSILVTGVKSPFSPFHVPAYEDYVAYELGRERRWTVVMLREGPRGGEGLVRRVGLEDVALGEFDYAYAFHADGTLASAYNREHLKKAEEDTELRDRILIPEIAMVQKELRNEPDKWYHHQKAGAVYWDWGLAEPAREYFERALEMDRSGNPYPVYFLGLTEEARGDLAEAARLFRLAVEWEAESPNPAFRESLERVTGQPAGR